MWKGRARKLDALTWQSKAGLMLALGFAVSLLTCAPVDSAGESQQTLFSPPQTRPEHTGTETEPEGRHEEKPKLLDMSYYMETFKKKYSSKLEAATRHFYVLANALKVYKSGWAYRNRRASHHLKLNHLSDRSRLELERMHNYELLSTGPTRSSTGHDDAGGGKSSRPIVIDDEQALKQEAQLDEANLELERRIQQTLARHRLGDEGRGRLRRRKKRSLQEEGPRKLSMDDLIQTDQDASEPPEVRAKVNPRPRSNNPNYDPLALELDTRGLVDQQEEIKFWLLPAASSRTISNNRNPFAQPAGLETDEDEPMFDAESDAFIVSPRAQRLPDAVFADLRSTNCLFEPRDQGSECGCCYAFAGISMMEYLFCRCYGQLLAFSEQYMVDCGKGRVKTMNGCQGSPIYQIPYFMHNFGLELREHYPYAAREMQCPYHNDTDLRTTGFIRVHLGHSLSVPVDRWPEVLKRGPLLVAVAAGDNFSQYGRGVDSGADCAERENHAMMVVGHGREDGQEYWLLRNSFGVQWGERGHWKLAKSAPVNCIGQQMGFVFGTRDGKIFVEPKLNIDNPLGAAYHRGMQERAKSS